MIDERIHTRYCSLSEMRFFFYTLVHCLSSILPRNYFLDHCVCANITIFIEGSVHIQYIRVIRSALLLRLFYYSYLYWNNIGLTRKKHGTDCICAMICICFKDRSFWTSLLFLRPFTNASLFLFHSFLNRWTSG